LLYKDVKEGNVALEAYGEDCKRTTDNNEVFMLHTEYTEWKYKKFQVHWEAFGKPRMVEQKTIEGF
jgi:hypothetical protein